MEKVIYTLWRPADVARESFCAQLTGPVADRLLDRGAFGVEVDLEDSDVDGSLMRLSTTNPPMAAVVCIWLDTAVDQARHPVDALLADLCERFAAYLVTESVPLRNTSHPPELGKRTWGVNNIAFLRRPRDLDHATWLDRWQNEHTAVAIETQSTFGYVQNVVVRPLTEGAPAWDGIVSELFPPEALTDLETMFAAVGDPELCRQNLATMARSTARFGAAKDIEVLPTSQYVIATPFRDEG